MIDISQMTVVHRETGKVLLLKRNQEKNIMPGCWDFPGGHVEDETPETAAVRELEDETGLTGEIKRSGDTYTIPGETEEDEDFLIHPFLVEVNSDPEISSEHTDYCWIEPEELEDFETVLGLGENLRKVGILDKLDYEAVSAVVYNPNFEKYLLMKRAPDKDHYPNKWQFPGGIKEDGETPAQGVLRELREETGLEGEIKKSSGEFIFDSEMGRIRGFAFLIEVENQEVELSREHTDFEWVELEEISNFDTDELNQKDLEELDLIEKDQSAIAVPRHNETGEFLLVKRSNEEEKFSGKWEFPSGGVDQEDKNPKHAALRELREETGLEGEVVNEGKIGEAMVDHRIIVFHPFLINVESKEVSLSEEHSEFRWVEKKNIEKFDILEGVKKDLENLGL